MSKAKIQDRKPWTGANGRTMLLSLMPAIKVSSQTNLAPEECFKKIAAFFESDADLRRLDAGYKCQFDAKSMTGTATGSQFKAKLAVKPDAAGSVVSVEVDLPFHLSLLKGMVQKTLEKKLSAVLG